MKSSTHDFLYDSFCQPLDIIGCEKRQFGNTCHECSDGYIKNSWNKCSQIGIKFSIENCIAFKNESSCLKCKNGYHLSDDFSKCYLNRNIPDCLEYSQTSFETTCVLCQDNFKLHLGECIHVNFLEFIENCEVFDFLQLECSNCLPGYRISDDKKLCLEIIKNCKIYYHYTYLNDDGKDPHHIS